MVTVLQALPLQSVARLGRFFGSLAWTLDRKHRRVILENMRAAFPEFPEEKIQTSARETMLRIAENYAAAIKTASLTLAEVCQVCEVDGLENLAGIVRDRKARNCVVAIGHFGNFELYALLGNLMPGMRPASTYRGLNHSRLNGLLKSLRDRSGCRFFERRTEAKALKEALNDGGLLLGLLSDQHAGRGGVWGPFLGRPAATTPAPAVFALRYQAPLFTAICYRVAVGRWRVEVGPEIPTHENGAPRSVEAITAEINEAFEHAIRRDPSNWFWVHKRWKTRRAEERPPPAPSAGAAGLAAGLVSP